MAQAYILFQDQTLNNTSKEFCLDAGGDKYIFVSGVPDGASVIIQSESPNFPGTWMPMDGGDFVDVIGSRLMLRIPDNTNVRAELSNAGGSTSLTVEITK